MPRPLTGKLRKDIDVKVRIDREMNTDLLEYCQKHNKKRAAVIRTAIWVFLKIKKKQEDKKGV